MGTAESCREHSRPGQRRASQGASRPDRRRNRFDAKDIQYTCQIVVSSRIPAAPTSTPTRPFPAEAANIGAADFLPSEEARHLSIDQRIVKGRHGSVNVLRDWISSL